MKAVLKSVQKWMGQWQQQEQQAQVANTYVQQVQGTLYGTPASAFAQQAQAQYTNTFAPSMATTTAGSTFSGLGAPTPNSVIGMGGTFGPISTWTTAASPLPVIEMSDAQLDRFMGFLSRVMEKSWTCGRCARQYAPLTPDCEFCNLIERLEGVEKQEQVA